MHGDPLWMKVLLSIHIASGFGSFLLAPIALATAKGGKQHKRWGMVYLWCMGGVAVTALPMAIYRPVLFLALVAVFSFYLAFSGYRVLRLKDLARGGKPKPVDWIAGIVTWIASAALATFGVVRPHWVQNFTIVSLIFGFIGMRAAAVELKKFIGWRFDLLTYALFLGGLAASTFVHRVWAPGAVPYVRGLGLVGATVFLAMLVRHPRQQPLEKMFWWYTHLGNFIGSYIAAWSAFSVVTIAPRFGDGGMLVWLWPTIIGAPAITLTIVYYKRKFAPKPKGPASPTLAAA